MTTRVHHLNCATMRPYFPPIHAVAHCLLVETNDGLLLADTGFGLGDYARPTALVRVFTALLRTPCDPAETAARQVVRLGFAVEDVRHVVLTHLHLDHAGGLPDFPGAQVHVHALEHRAAMHPRGFLERFYVSAHWAHGPKWVLHFEEGERWFEFGAMRVLDGLSPRVLLIPLPGHSRGHCGVAVSTPAGWLLHCGDAYAAFSLMNADRPHSLVPAWLERRLLGPHLPRLQALARDHGDEVQLFCAHDLFEFSRFLGGGASTLHGQP